MCCSRRPSQPLEAGAENLSLYRDIATLDQGPGYWNGILSLWLNGTSPATEYNSENEKAQSYFHRAKAAELIADLDKHFPNAPERPALHAQLIAALAQYGDAATTLAAGKQFLAAFPAASQRTDVAGLMADAYARQKNTTAEFALYDSLLAELAQKTAGQPLAAAHKADTAETPDADTVPEPKPATAPAVLGYTTKRPENAEADHYVQLLDRYLGRLVAEQQLPAAVAVLRRQIDRSPDDPALYEKLAAFLQQNNLGGQQEAVFKAAIARFQQPTWYDKLARYYLRQKNKQAFTALTRQVTDIFSGTELEAYFARVRDFSQPEQGGPQLALQLNLYAAKRFPHDQVFVTNLLAAYATKPTANPVAYEALLRLHWYQSDALRNDFFALLSRTGKLQAEFAKLKPLATEADPAATRELAEADLWTSHFEDAATPLSALAKLYPAEADIDDRAVSLFRSLAYLDPTDASTNRAVSIETNLLAFRPDSPERLGTLGDLYASTTSESGEDLASATPSWRRIPSLHPGSPAGYLDAATVFWDYFQFDDASGEIQSARARFNQPALFGYQAGAIAEGRHDLPTAVREYIGACVHPVPPGLLPEPADYQQDSSEAGQARNRLLQLAARNSTKAIIDQASAEALAADPQGSGILTLRAELLVAERHETQLAPLFNDALARATTRDQADNIGNLARIHSLPQIYEQALAKEAALTNDPVDRIQLQYALAQALEARKDIAGAAHIMDTVYQANPRLLGVVRATTDFYARTQQPPKAIATLLAAAKVATPTLAHGFTLEAADKANDAGDTAQARSLALTLLPAAPYDPQILGILAQSYARANDNDGLRRFYLAQIDQAKADPKLTPDQRKANTALLRRGLIPALTGLHDDAGALDQYIALLSAYPEDAGTGQQAALYALRHNLQAQLTGFLAKTVKDSPRDSRFAILLAQVETTFGDLPAALAAYDQAITIRKDRADLYQGRVDLELRLSRLDPAADDLNRLYLLTYKDPQYIVRLAELRTPPAAPGGCRPGARNRVHHGPSQGRGGRFQSRRAAGTMEPARASTRVRPAGDRARWAGPADRREERRRSRNVCGNRDAAWPSRGRAQRARIAA